MISLTWRIANSLLLLLFLYLCSCSKQAETEVGNLSVCDGTLLDFGIIVLGQSVTQTVTVQNKGTSTIKLSGIPTLTAPFSYLGEVFPGTGGTCQITLPAGQSCTTVLQFLPTELVGYTQEVTISYTQNDVPFSKVCDLTGMARHSYGGLDTSFHSDGMVLSSIGSSPNSVGDVAVQTDGKVLVVGGATESSVDKVALFRFEGSGILDTTFHTDGKVTTSGPSGTASGSGITLLTDGKIAVAGYATATNSDFMLVKYLTDGSLDTTFHTDGRALITFSGSLPYDVAQSLAVQTDGKLVVVGTSDDASVTDLSLARLSTDGTLDTSFSTDGKYFADLGGDLDALSSIKLDANGLIYATGITNYTSNHDVMIMRFRSNGSLDSAFHTDGLSVSSTTAGYDVYPQVLIQTDGKPVVGSYFYDETDSKYKYQVFRFRTSGNLDSNFHTDGRVVIHPNVETVVTAGAIDLQTDGKLILGITYPKAPIFAYGLIRIYSDGTIDTAFGTLGTTLSTIGTDILAKSAVKIYEGYIVQAGLQGRVGSNFYFALARYWQ